MSQQAAPTTLFPNISPLSREICVRGGYNAVLSVLYWLVTGVYQYGLLTPVPVLSVCVVLAGTRVPASSYV